ncbi:hypothetical protein EG835_12935 [bacterium]|nr:hypothetical protein [bacterium]
MGWKAEVILGALAGLILVYPTAPHLAETHLRIARLGQEVTAEEVRQRAREYRIAGVVATLLIIVMTVMQ